MAAGVRRELGYGVIPETAGTLVRKVYSLLCVLWHTSLCQ